jgi:Ca2+/Na+ antiporter
LDPLGSVEVTAPPTQGERSHYVAVAFGSLFFIVFCIIALSALIFVDSGFIYKIIHSEGVIRKKFLFLIISIAMYAISIIIYALVQLAVLYMIFTIIILVSFCFFYLGLREEPEKKEKIKPTKEVKVKGDLFRISKYRKEDITEEEVSISKEKKICLVCKGKLSRTIHLCPVCNVLYCQKCALALTNLENACWVCNAPFDESKPVKPFKKAEEIEEIEISEKPQKKSKQLKE